MAATTGFASGLGSKAVDLIPTSNAPLLSYSVEELGFECGSRTYLPRRRADEVLRRGIRGFIDWSSFQHQAGAIFAGTDLLEISIQGGSERAVVLTGIRFDVRRLERRPGAVFAAPCGDSLIGRGVNADVQADPVKIIASSRSPDGILGPGDPPPNTKPISFPWTVSLTDPLLLYVAASASTCRCVWSAEIPWVSGSERGAIRVDNDGKGFAVVGEEGLPSYSASSGGWRGPL